MELLVIPLWLTKAPVFLHRSCCDGVACCHRAYLAKSDKISLGLGNEVRFLLVVVLLCVSFELSDNR